MANQLFGINVPEYTPVDVFPYDADYKYKRGRAWQTKVVQFSPVLEQRFILADNPLFQYEIGFDVLTGDAADPSSRAGTLYNFFNTHLGRATQFWFYDPAAWGFYPAPYNTDPTSRLSHPTDAKHARYIALFDEDSMSSEIFEYRLQRAQLKISMYPG